MAGHESLAGLMHYSNANDVIVDMAPEILSAVSHTSVITRVCGTGPLKDMPRFLRQLKEMGFAGVQNSPLLD